MAMVDVAWMSVRHEVKQIVDDSHGTISRLAISRWPVLSETTCLRFIDAYGDAMFNQAQLPVLTAELQAEVASQKNPRDREHIEKVIKLIEGALGETDTYVAFLGD